MIAKHNQYIYLSRNGRFAQRSSHLDSQPTHSLTNQTHSPAHKPRTHIYATGSPPTPSHTPHTCAHTSYTHTHVLAQASHISSGTHKFRHPSTHNVRICEYTRTHTCTAMRCCSSCPKKRVSRLSRDMPQLLSVSFEFASRRICIDSDWREREMREKERDERERERKRETSEKERDRGKKESGEFK